MKNKRIIGAFAVLLAVIIPIGFFLGITASVEDTYSETFVAALGPKFERLCSIDEPKLVLIGGSSVAFGVDSAILAEKLSMEVVNFGLYATLGTKLMLDLSRANINEGDIVVISPETDAQTLSLYFNAETTWQAMESNGDMLAYVDFDDLASMAGSYYDYSITKFRYKVRGVKLSPTGVYRSDSFNEYGDIDYERSKNSLYSATGIAHDASNLIELTPDIVSEDFINYVNEYTAWCEKRGAVVYYSFCPMNEDALSDGSYEAMVELYGHFARELDCTVINSPLETVLEAEYFYDTNFHLNTAGVRLHTKNLLTALYRELGRTELPDVELLKKPKLKKFKAELGTAGNEYADMFIYERYGEGWCIVGTTDAAKDAKYLEIPSSYGNRQVIAIGANAFAGCKKLTEIKVYKNITVFMESMFSGLTGQFTVYMDVDDAEYMTDPSQFLPQVSVSLLENTSAQVKFMFSQSCFERYLQDYNWQQYSELFDIGTKE